MTKVIRRFFLNKRLIYASILLFIICLGFATVYVSSQSHSSKQAHLVQDEKSVEKASAESDINSLQPSPALQTQDEINVSTEKESSTSRTNTSNPKSSPAPVAPTYTSAPPVHEIGVTYLSLYNPAVYCSGGGDYYIVTISDVNVSFRGNAGGQLTYGYEVSGGLKDSWNGYRQPATVPAGVYSSSFNKLYWGNTSDPHTAYSEVVYSGHAAGAVRAVVYSPSLVYSSWVSVPAQQHGEKCA